MREKAKILIVDDEPSVRIALEITLRRPEWQVETAESAEDALILCKKTSYDLFLLDKNLADKSGIDFVHELREQESDAAVIIITGYASAKSAIELAHLGIDAYLEKPFRNIFEIAKKVEVSLEKLRIRRDKERALAGQHADDAEEDRTMGSRDSFGTAGDLTRDSLSPSEPLSDCAILVASPDEKERAWLEAHLKGWGSVESVSSSQEVLHRLENETLDLVVVDFVVTGPNIFELVEALKKQAPDTACLVTLEHPQLRTLTKLINLGVSGVMEKPFDKHYFFKEMKKIFQTSVIPVPSWVIEPTD